MITITRKAEDVANLLQIIVDEFDNRFYNMAPQSPNYTYRLFVLTGVRGMEAIKMRVREVYGQVAEVQPTSGRDMYMSYNLPWMDMQVAWHPQFDYAYEGKPKHPKTGFPLSSFQCDVYVESEPAFRIQFVA